MAEISSVIGSALLYYQAKRTTDSDFKRYTKEQFREDDQHVLAQVYNELVELGAYPVLSNSYSELTLDLYGEHQILVVYANRNINHEGTGRDPIPEIIVKPR